MTTLAQQARRLRKILAVPDAWIAGDLAQNKDGDGVRVMSPSACRFCLIGAGGRVISADTPVDMHYLFSSMGFFPEQTELGRLLLAVVRGRYPELENCVPHVATYSFNDKLYSGMVPGTEELSKLQRHAVLLDVLDEVVIHAEAVEV